MDISIKEILHDFLVYISKERNFSNHTVSAYERDLKKFINYIYDFHHESFIDLNLINRSQIRQFMGIEFESGLSSKTVARRLASIKSFFNYLIQIELITDSPASHVKSPKIEKNIPNFIHNNKINFLMQIPNIKTLIGKRDLAILELFYATGMRLSELVALNISSVNHNDKLVKVLGKGNKERIIPFGNNAMNTLEAYLNARGLN